MRKGLSLRLRYDVPEPRTRREEENGRDFSGEPRKWGRRHGTRKVDRGWDHPALVDVERRKAKRRRLLGTAASLLVYIKLFLYKYVYIIINLFIHTYKLLFIYYIKYFTFIYNINYIIYILFVLIYYI